MMGVKITSLIRNFLDCLTTLTEMVEEEPTEEEEEDDCKNKR